MLIRLHIDIYQYTGTSTCLSFFPIHFTTTHFPPKNIEVIKPDKYNITEYPVYRVTYVTSTMLIQMHNTSTLNMNAIPKLNIQFNEYLSLMLAHIAR